MVTETAEVYREVVRPYMERKREGGRLNWVFNIIEGKTEVEDVIFRTPLGKRAARLKLANTFCEICWRLEIYR